MDELAQVLQSKFARFDDYVPSSMGFAAAIDYAMKLTKEIQDAAYFDALDVQTKCAACELALRDLSPVICLPGGERVCRSCVSEHPKIAELGEVGAAMSPVQRAARALGAMGQLWTAPELGIPQKPSTLGQLLVLGGLGAAAGYGAGHLANKLMPNDYVDYSRPGAILGGAAGALPAVVGGTLNHFSSEPIFTRSFWDSPDSFKAASMIPVDRFQDIVWGDMSVASRLPPTLQAAASGLVEGAANLPGKAPGTPFVSPMDIARVAMGLGGGAAAGYVFGKTVGRIFGLKPKAQNLIIGSGAFAGMLNALTPKVYGEQ